VVGPGRRRPRPVPRDLPRRAASALSRTAVGPPEPTAPERLVSRRPVSAPDGHERRPGRTR
jgi:hypothetical protein